MFSFTWKSSCAIHRIGFGAVSRERDDVRPLLRNSIPSRLVSVSLSLSSSASAFEDPHFAGGRVSPSPLIPGSVPAAAHVLSPLSSAHRQLISFPRPPLSKHGRRQRRHHRISLSLTC